MEAYGKGNHTPKNHTSTTTTTTIAGMSGAGQPAPTPAVGPQQTNGAKPALQSQSMANLLSQLSSMSGPRRGKKKRKLAELDTARHLAELEDLREWKRRCEEKEKQLNSLITSSCIVCLYTRPDLISYGACGHMVCVNCTLEHVSRRLMVMRRRSQNTGCKARLSRFGLNAEDSEFSCPLCRKGQLDLMGAGLSLLPDFAYYQLSQFCSKSNEPKTLTPPPPPLTQPTGICTDLKSNITNLVGLSEERRAMVLAQLERNRLAAMKSIQNEKEQRPSELTTHKICCPFCGLGAANPGEATGKDKLLPSEVLRHVWRCKKRSFVCGFSDCRKHFTWEGVYAAHAPTSVGGISTSSESKWLELVNHAFSEHMMKECTHMTQCCIGWCDMYRAPAQIPLSQFHEHEERHKAIHDRFQQIGTLADVALKVEKTLASLLRREFAKSNITNTTKEVVAPPGTIRQATTTTTTIEGKEDVMTVAGPIAREVHNSLEALNEVLFFHATHGQTNVNRDRGAVSDGDVEMDDGTRPLRADTRCPLHPGMGLPQLPPPPPRTRASHHQQQIYIRHGNVFLERDGDDLFGGDTEDEEYLPDSNDVIEATSTEDDDDDDDDYEPDGPNNSSSSSSSSSPPHS